MTTKHTPLTHTEKCVYGRAWESNPSLAKSTAERAPTCTGSKQELPKAGGVEPADSAGQTMSENSGNKSNRRRSKHTAGNAPAVARKNLVSSRLTTSAATGDDIGKRSGEGGGSTSGSQNEASLKAITGCSAITATAPEDSSGSARTRLEKAAPDLLAACEEAQEALDVLAEDIADSFPARSENTTDLAMRIRAAIARARGEKGESK